MNMSAIKLRLASAVVFLVASAALSGCGDSTASPSPQILRFSVIPDWNKGKLAADSLSLAKLLSEKLGVEVRYEQTNSYLACVNALAANKIDFASEPARPWLQKGSSNPLSQALLLFSGC